MESREVKHTETHLIPFAHKLLWIIQLARENLKAKSKGKILTERQPTPLRVNAKLKRGTWSGTPAS